jgi:DNA-directed RNA polymerase subunit RPC12/RpoP
MADLIKCPNCGASNADKKSETEYVCNYCESQFVIGQKKSQTTVDDALRQMHRVYSQQKTVASPKSVRLVVLMIVISVFGVGIGIFVSVYNAINSSIESGPGTIAEDDYYNAASPNKFYVFTGDKGPVVWFLMNQSSKKLDSSKYSLQLVDPKKNELIKQKHFITMTWQESFNFGNYLSEMVCARNNVYFLSDAKGINVYDLYSGKLIIDNKKFANRFPELKGGIVSAKNMYYKNAIELMTNDGFKYYFLPLYDLLVSEKDFNDYQKGQGFIGGFVVSGEPRQKLYYIISKQDTLRNDFSFSEYYLDDYLRKGKLNGNGEKGFAVDTSQTFFNVNFLLRNKNQVIFVTTENVAKDSKASIISYSKNDFTKPLWKTDLSSIKGFENAVKDGYYLRTNVGKNELAVWYESATKIAFGLELKTGKINWDYSLK